MRNIEINSDKTTVLTVLLVLALVLVGFVSKLHRFLVHRPVALPHLEFGLFSSALIIAYLAVICGRDSKIRKAYPYAVAGLCLTTGWFLVAIVMQWAKASLEAQNLLLPILMVIDIVGSGLILFEGVRWFRARVKLAEIRAE
jgi:hypothetical protein